MVKYKLFKDGEDDEIRIVKEDDKRCNSKKLLFIFAGLGILLITFLFFIIIYSRFTQLARFQHEQANIVDLLDKGEIRIKSSDNEDINNGFVIEDHDLTISDHLHVIKDYSNNIQIMKLSSAENTVCYLAPLKNPAQKTNINQNKSYSNIVFEVKEIVFTKESDSFTSPGMSKSFQKKLSDLCANTPVLVLEETHSHMTSSLRNITGHNHDSQEQNFRWKRNIRQCKTSCCYVVCCCDVKHFVFQNDHEFSCIHVCDVCSDRYSKRVQKIC